MSRNFQSPQYMQTPPGAVGPAAETQTLAPAQKPSMGPMSSPKIPPASMSPTAYAPPVMPTAAPGLAPSASPTARLDASTVAAGRPMAGLNFIRPSKN